MSKFWTDERVAYLRKNWPTMRAKIIARQLGCTCNAVIGKANRLGLPAISRDTIKKRISHGRREWAQRVAA